MGTDLLIPGALVSNTTERSDKASVVSASLALAAYPDEEDELELLDEELVEEEAAEDELLDDELLEDELLEDELLEDEPAVPPHPLSTTAKAASARFKDFIVRSKRSVIRIEGLSHGLQSRFRYAIHILCIPGATMRKTFQKLAEQVCSECAYFGNNDGRGHIGASHNYRNKVYWAIKIFIHLDFLQLFF